VETKSTEALFTKSKLLTSASILAAQFAQPSPFSKSTFLSIVSVSFSLTIT